jgi:WxcM-like, C-terminal
LIPTLTVGRCKWLDAPSHGIAEDGWITWTTRSDIGFEVKRAFWLTDVPSTQWRGRHAHRESILATFAIAGSCQMHLDDGATKQTVALEKPARGLIIGNWVWHELTDFTPNTVILVLASTAYDEAEYLRDYNVFLRDAP